MSDNIFDGLENLVAKTSDVLKSELFKKKEAASGTGASAARQIKPEDCVYKANITCPACDSQFQDRRIKQRVARLIKSDTDLRPYYEPIEPLYYDVTMCEKCGYTAISAMFPKLTERQADKIKEKVTPVFKSKQYPLVLSAEDAVERYKMALFNCVAKDGSNGEKAYLCLKIAWVLRGLNDKKNELVFLKNAFVGFEKAFSTERFPICGLDENTLTYILSDIARRTGDFDTSLRYISTLLADSRVPQRVKDKALVLKQLARSKQCV